jgi:hypothetical protein
MIGFESSETYIRRQRERLQAMDDEELIKFGKYAKSLAGIRVSGLPDPYKIQLDEAKTEWRRRHPKQSWFPQNLPGKVKGIALDEADSTHGEGHQSRSSSILRCLTVEQSAGEVPAAHDHFAARAVA